MQPANDQTVLGDFNGARFTSRGLTTSFARRDGKYFITTEGPDGKPAEYEVKYTFGVEPLQEYLVAFPGGRLQVPTVGGDTQNKRWFALYPNERHKPDDPLHSTGRYQNWNLMCSECHSTDVRRGYDAKADTYDTKWAQLNVGCQACHGPGSAHLAWAQSPARRTPGVSTRRRARPGRGFPRPRFTLSDRDVRAVSLAATTPDRRRDAGEALARRLPSRVAARKGSITPTGSSRTRSTSGALSCRGRMYAKGVRCSDCHDPHSLHLRAEGNALCAQCHQSAGNERFRR